MQRRVGLLGQVTKQIPLGERDADRLEPPVCFAMVAPLQALDREADLSKSHRLGSF
jgi:hypothetical protein